MAFQVTITNTLPETGFVRLWDIIGDRKRGIPAVLPVSRSTFLAGVKSGKYPQPVRLGTRAIGWKVEDIRSLIESTGE